jgi:hypothetical protein
MFRNWRFFIIVVFFRTGRFWFGCVLRVCRFSLAGVGVELIWL